MNTSKYPKKPSYHYLKKNIIPQSPLNQTISQQLQKPIENNEQKSICQKYLNVYQSIKRKQNLQVVSKFQNTVSKIKKSALKTKGIFQNSIIQNSYPKNQKAFNQSNQAPNQNKLTRSLIHEDKQIFTRKKTIPSKKNQMTLKIITQHKILEDQKQNYQQMSQKMIIKGEQLIEGSNHNKTQNLTFHNDRNSFSQRKQLNQERSNSKRITNPYQFSYWQTNSFIGYNVNKAYTGYYKAKNKKKYSKQKSKCLRNSTSFIKQIDQSMLNSKFRQLVIRPKTCQLKNRNLPTDFNFIDSSADYRKLSQFGTHQKIIRTQSQAKLKNTQKQPSPDKQKNITYFGLMRKNTYNSPNEFGFIFNGKQSSGFERKNYKKYTFHSKFHRSILNNQSYQMEMNKSDNNLILGVTTQSAFKDNSLHSYMQQDSSRNEFYGNYLQSKKLYQRKYLKQGNKNSKTFHSRKGSSVSSHNASRIIIKNNQITLNKIQETIQNDLQIRIQQIKSPI